MNTIAIITTDLRDEQHRYSEPRPIFGYAPSAFLQGFQNHPDCAIHIVSCVQQPVISPAKVAENMFYHSVRIRKWGWLRGGYAGCILAIRKKLREIRPDIVHGHGTERYCAISAALSAYPNVVTIHGNMRAIAKFYRSRIGSFHWLTARMETFALRKTFGVLCNSAYTESLVAPRTRRVWRVPNSLRLEFFEQAAVSPCKGKPILLNVGVLSGYKRQAEILGVARKLWLRGFRFEMQFAGATETQTPYGANFMRQLAEAQADGYARHIGLLPANELIAAMDAASALVHFPCEESFGLVVAEALARNLKLFAASTGGIIDIAADIDGAELFPPDDWTGLENAIARWIENGFPQPKFASEVMRSRYHPESLARRHLQIYKEVLSSNNSPVSH